MSKGVNKVLIIGLIGAEPKVTALKNGSQVVNINIATNESYKDKSTGQLVKKTEWHKVVFFNKLAEIAAQYLKKGAQVYVEGSLQTRKYVKQDIEHTITEIVARNMQMLDRRSDGATTERKAYQHPIEKAQQDSMGMQSNRANHMNYEPDINKSTNTPEDDIPF